MPHHSRPRDRHRLVRGLILVALSLALAVTTLGQQPTNAQPSALPTGAVDPGAKIAPALQRKFDTDATEPRDFWISFDADADTSAASATGDWARRGQQVVDRLRSTAKTAQADTIAALDAAGADYTAYWITNAIRVHGGDYTLALSLAGSTDVERIFAPVSYTEPEPVKQELTGRMSTHDAAPEWGVRDIKADQVWQKYGARGDGIVVASIDTGTELDHPALVEHYRGSNGDGTFTNDYNWLDTTGASDFPTDAHGHGTHTMGTMVGDDGAANQVGVAPGAKWIEANGCCASDETLLAASQWMLAPTKTDGTAPDPAKRPHVVNNSWGSENPATDPFLEDIQQAWADSGIFGVWSNGNLGPACNTASSPGSRTLNYAVGATTEAGTIASFSSRGTGQDGEIKPNIAAPGEGVRSSYPGGRYASMSGTSMAAPHVSGSVALLLSAHPELIGDVAQIRQLLDETAIDTADDQCGGTDADNNVYGEGRLDALALVEAVDSGDSGAIDGKVTVDGGEPVEGAAVTLTGDAGQRSTRTGGDGAYAVAELPIGTYQATVTAFGFAPGKVTIEVTSGQSTTTNVSLAAAEGFTVSGVITDRTTGKPIAGTASVIGSRYSATADASGHFAIKGVPGPRNYTVRIDDGGACATPVYRSLEITGDAAIAPVELRRRTDEPASPAGWNGGPYGYSCLLEPTKWIKGTTEIEKPDVYDTTAVRLPFRFSYFGKDYSTIYASPTSLAQVGFWTSPYNSATYPYAEYGIDTLIRGIVPSLGPIASDDGSAKLLTRTTGTAPNRAFTIEFRDFTVLNSPDTRMSYEVTLHEDGDIVFAYDGIDPANLLERGQQTEVSMQDHSPDGRAGLRTQFLYSVNEPILGSDRQIRFSLPANGFVSGLVTDKRTGAAVANASVDLVDANGWLTQRAFTNAAGRYRFQLMAGRNYTVSVLKRPGYAAQRASVRVTRDRQTIMLRTPLSGGRMTLPTSVTAKRGRAVRVSLKNTGSAALRWRASLALPATSGPKPGTEVGRTDYGKAAIAVEEVDGQYWVGDVLAHRAVEVTSTGSPTGRTIPLAPVAEALGVTDDLTLTPADLAWVPSRGMLCMTFYNFTNDIACVDPDRVSAHDIAVVETGLRSALSVQGLAYDAERDRFFVIAGARSGGWQHQVRTIAGLEHPNTGDVLGRCTYARQGQGLGWNPDSQALWTHTQDITGIPLKRNMSKFRQVDPATCAEQATVNVPSYSMPGMPSTSLDLDEHGDLVTMFFASGTIVTVRTSDPITRQPRWVSVPTDTGAVGVNKTVSIPVRINWAAVPKGVKQVNLVLRGNGGARPTRVVPITLRR
ncbi:S8 family serine peptidase [Nocardioides sp. Root151]|uniref:S8 family serine peptidase n=1 Tax=Nocardioides sp. Root151 TaxID=1736475 RepID=UPI000703A72D|nr:S8 family serine peptidase [Nocardioides sp. Root151]